MFANISVRRLGARRELALVLIGAALAWLVATVAVAQSTEWPLLAILPLTLLFALFVGAVYLAIATNPARSWPSVLGRGLVALLVGVVVGELAALVLFSGSIDRRLDEQAVRSADSTPAVAQAQANLDRTRAAQTTLNNAVEQARIHRDQALTVARCEYNPSPACPQTQITGVPGPGPETRTANQLLADTQQELDNALASRDRHAAELTSAEQVLQQARSAATHSDHGLGARWVAMHEHTLSSAGAMVLWAVTIGFFTLLSLLPLIIKLMQPGSKGVRAELDADTSISVKRAQVRAEIENLWADQQLTSARLAVDAQNEIDREFHRRRVAEALEALEAPVKVTAEQMEDDMYLPIEGEAEAAALNAAKHLPARVDDGPDRGTSLIPTVATTAARWIRPFVPPVVARAIDTTTKPLRTARQVFEEVEEVTFAFKRTHKMTVSSEESPDPSQQHDSSTTRPRGQARQVESSRITDDGSAGQLRGHANRLGLPPGE